MINHYRNYREYSILIFRFILTIFLVFSVSGAKVVTASRGLTTLQQPYISPFLYPPYAGSVGENSIMDHNSPVNAIGEQNGVILAFTGNTATGNPANGLVYFSTELGYTLSYDQHEGLDYDLNYEPVFASADSDQIEYAGWANPGNHNAGLGLNVGLLHANGYRTYYGHFSSIAVVTCPTFQCVPVKHGDVIGISGNTGHSDGPHLHFEVRNPIADLNGNFRTRIDPYGWTGTGADPAQDDWRSNPNQSLWVDYPEISSTDSLLYALNEGTR
ncbi:MAG: hypothetical protein CNIPEHKO_00227 [Anaerolineales bacterium]|nr:hypothetical protein [Anaerolineales bacterium]